RPDHDAAFPIEAGVAADLHPGVDGQPQAGAGEGPERGAVAGVEGQVSEDGIVETMLDLGDAKAEAGTHAEPHVLRPQLPAGRVVNPPGVQRRLPAPRLAPGDGRVLDRDLPVNGAEGARP